MRRLYVAALAYMILGLAAGLFYREYTNTQDFTGSSQLSVMHTHLLAVGMLFFLVLMALEALLGFMKTRLAGWFYWVYNLGFLLTVAMMAVHGIRTVLGKGDTPALDGISGLGHMIITAGLILLFIALYKALPRTRTDKLDTDQSPPAATGQTSGSTPEPDTSQDTVST